MNSEDRENRPKTASLWRGEWCRVTVDGRRVTRMTLGARRKKKNSDKLDTPHADSAVAAARNVANACKSSAGGDGAATQRGRCRGVQKWLTRSTLVRE